MNRDAAEMIAIIALIWLALFGLAPNMACYVLFVMIGLALWDQEYKRVYVTNRKRAEQKLGDPTLLADLNALRQYMQ